MVDQPTAQPGRPVFPITLDAIEGSVSVVGNGPVGRFNIRFHLNGCGDKEYLLSLSTRDALILAARIRMMKKDAKALCKELKRLKGGEAPEGTEWTDYVQR